MLLHSLMHIPAADLGHKTTRVVLLCDHRNEESVVPLIECLSWYEGVELHVVDSQSAEGLGGKPPTVIPPSWDRREMQSHSLGGEAPWHQCGPGRRMNGWSDIARELVTLVIVQEQPRRGFGKWWQTSMPERLANYVPVLSVPVTNHGPFDASVPFRWLVVLDGSPFAEDVLYPLRSLARWLPSDVSLLQPLEFAQLWNKRIAARQPSELACMGVSIADSIDYLRYMAEEKCAGLGARICCVSDEDSVSAVVRTIESGAVDGVAIGLSKRTRMARRFTCEFNELLLTRIKKPYLLARAS